MERKPVHAYLSSEAHEAWHLFAAENGVSVSALLEVMPGRIFSTRPMAEVIKEARSIDATRRRRS